MPIISNTVLRLSSSTDTAPLRAKWHWIVALGLIYLIAGSVALGSVVLATVASVFLVGIMMIVAGIAEIINAFQLKGWSKFLIWILLGALYVFAGFATFENPLLAAAVLTLVLGMAMIASGLVRIFLALSMKRESPWVLLLLSSLVTMLLGFLILAHWPVSGVYALGIFLGVDLMIAGATWVSLGLALRRGNAHLPARARTVG